jgi:hypothetical protein
MRRAAAVLLLVALTLAVVAPPAEACLECVALGLASFAVFTQLVSALTAPPVVYAAPAYYPPAYYAPYAWPYRTAYASAAYYPAAYYPPAYYPPTYYPGSYYVSYPAAYASPAPAPRAVWTGPSVVHYAHGRYELRGDGVSAPYAWVWIPTAAPNPAPAAPADPSLDGPEGSGGARNP